MNLKFSNYNLNSMRLNLILFLLIVANSASFSYSPCSTNQILNIKDLSCSSCPTNQIPNPTQNIPTSCICAKGYYPTTNHTCNLIISSGTNCSNTSFYQIFGKDGSISSLPLSSCSSCAANAYPNT